MSLKEAIDSEERSSEKISSEPHEFQSLLEDTEEDSFKTEEDSEDLLPVLFFNSLISSIGTLAVSFVLHFFSMGDD